MTDALAAEWCKLRTLAAAGWLLAATAATMVAVSAIVAVSTHISHGGGQDPTKLALAGTVLGQAVIAVLAVLTVSEEYATGMILVTLTAVPRRFLVLLAKAANLTLVTLPAALLAVAGCLVAGRLLLPGAGLDAAHGYALVSIGHGPTLRAAAGTVLYLALIGLLALGIATAIRDTAVSIGAVLALLYLPPILAQLVADPLRRHLQQIFPMTAGLAVQATRSGSQPIAPWAGLAVLAAWAVAALLVGTLLLERRDV